MKPTLFAGFPVVLVDSREQVPFEFPVPTEIAGLTTGDYSLIGHEHRVAIERKRGGELLGLVGRGRERWEICLERLREVAIQGAAAVVVEQKPLDTILRHCQDRTEETKLPDGSRALVRMRGRSGVHPNAYLSSLVDWSRDHWPVEWHFCDGHEAAAKWALRFLVAWWERHKAGPRPNGELVRDRLLRSRR
jgi:hypothetical protein